MDDLLASKQSSDEATGLAKDLIGILDWWGSPNKVDVKQPRSASSDPFFGSGMRHYSPRS